MAEALQARPKEIHQIYYFSKARHSRLNQLVEQARQQGIKLIGASKIQLNQAAQSTSHQGIVAVMEDYSYIKSDKLIAEALDKEERPLLLLLDGIQDPHNLGAVLRSAEVFGVNGIILPQDRAAGVTPAVAKVACGAADRLPISLVVNMVRCMEILKSCGFWLAGATPEDGSPPMNFDLTGPIALVIGGEDKGLRPLVKRKCDFLLSITQLGEVSSLNTAVAAGILLYEIQRQRNSS